MHKCFTGVNLVFELNSKCSGAGGGSGTLIKKYNERGFEDG